MLQPHARWSCGLMPWSATVDVIDPVILPIRYRNLVGIVDDL
jgi:hypothetical protein